MTKHKAPSKRSLRCERSELRLAALRAEKAGLKVEDCSPLYAYQVRMERDALRAERDDAEARFSKMLKVEAALRADLAAAIAQKEEAEKRIHELEEGIMDNILDLSKAGLVPERVAMLLDLRAGTDYPNREDRDARIRREALEDAWKRIVALGMGAEVIWVSAGMYVRDAIFNAAPPVSEGKEEVTWDAVEGAESYRLSITAPQTREEDGDE